MKKLVIGSLFFLSLSSFGFIKLDDVACVQKISDDINCSTGSIYQYTISATCRLNLSLKLTDGLFEIREAVAQVNGSYYSLPERIFTFIPALLLENEAKSQIEADLDKINLMPQCE